MDFDGSRYYTLNRMMLSSIGLWPYQNMWHIRIQRISCLFCVISCIITQLSTFVTSEYNLDLLLEVLSYTIPCFIVILKYVAYCVKIKSIRMLMEIIKHDWSTLKNKVEYEIIKKYTYIGAFYAQLFAIMTYSVPIIFGCIHFIPNLLDFVAPLNQSRPHHILILAEYFIDSDEYFYLILLHMVVWCFTIQITLMSTTSIYVAFIQHACGMFKIASYYIEHTFSDDYKKRNPASGKRCIVCNRIISAIDIHRRAIEFFESLKNTFVIMYFFLLVLGIASLTVNLCRVVFAKGIVENILSVISLFVHLFYFFFVNYSGQKILNHSNDFLSRTYNSKWHTIPLHAQKLILFVMQRSSKNCVLLIGGLYVLSYEGFATAMSLSMSYFMVFYSIR